MIDVLGNYLASNSEFLALVPTIVRTRLPKNYTYANPALIILGPYDHEDGRTTSGAVSRKVQRAELHIVGKTHSDLLPAKAKLLNILRDVKDQWLPSVGDEIKIFTQCILIQSIVETNTLYETQYNTRQNPGSDEKGFPIVKVDISYAFDEPNA